MTVFALVQRLLRVNRRVTDQRASVLEFLLASVARILYFPHSKQRHALAVFDSMRRGVNEQMGVRFKNRLAGGAFPARQAFAVNRFVLEERSILFVRF